MFAAPQGFHHFPHYLYSPPDEFGIDLDAPRNIVFSAASGDKTRPDKQQGISLKANSLTGCIR
jgi:hypothetical protein